jgi:urease accessory protein
VRIAVAAGGLLLWKAEPFIIADGADVTRSTTVDLAETGVACLRETLVLGRTGERGGALLTSSRVTHGGSPLLAEVLDLTDGPSRERPGILGPRRVIDTLSLFGRRAETPPGSRTVTRYQLAGEGTVARYLGAEVHLSEIPTEYAAWRDQLSHRNPES